MNRGFVLYGDSKLLKELAAFLSSQGLSITQDLHDTGEVARDERESGGSGFIAVLDPIEKFADTYFGYLENKGIFESNLRLKGRNERIVIFRGDSPGKAVRFIQSHQGERFELDVTEKDGRAALGKKVLARQKINSYLEWTPLFWGGGGFVLLFLALLASPIFPVFIGCWATLVIVDVHSYWSCFFMAEPKPPDKPARRGEAF